MKKILLGALLLLSTIGFSQTTIYSENFGNYTTNYTSRMAVNGFYIPFNTFTFQNQNSIGNCLVHYSGFTFYEVISGGNSTYYPSNNVGASGYGSILLRYSNTTAVSYFQINNIDTSAYSVLTLSFNHLVAANPAIYPFDFRMVVEQSVDGVNWSNLKFNQTKGSWYNVSISLIVSTPKLSLRFSRPAFVNSIGGFCASSFGIDDIKIISQTLSNDDFNEPIVKYVYPNPVNNTLFFNDSFINYTLSDIYGKQLLFGYSNKVDVSMLVRGVYFLKDNDKIRTIKIIKL
jgi:hypothetical protein